MIADFEASTVLAFLALRLSARSKPAAGNCSNKRAIQWFRMRAFAAGQAGTTLNEARSAKLQARG